MPAYCRGQLWERSELQPRPGWNHVHAQRGLNTCVCYSADAAEAAALLVLRSGGAATTLLRDSCRAPSTERWDDSRSETPSGTHACWHMLVEQPRRMLRLSVLSLYRACRPTHHPRSGGLCRYRSVGQSVAVSVGGAAGQGDVCLARPPTHRPPILSLAAWHAAWHKPSTARGLKARLSSPWCAASSQVLRPEPPALQAPAPAPAAAGE